MLFVKAQGLCVVEKRLVIRSQCIMHCPSREECRCIRGVQVKNGSEVRDRLIETSKLIKTQPTAKTTHPSRMSGGMHLVHHDVSLRNAPVVKGVAVGGLQLYDARVVLHGKIVSAGLGEGVRAVVEELDIVGLDRQGARVARRSLSES